MTETLAGVSPSKTEDLFEQPSLAEAAVAGLRALGSRGGRGGRPGRAVGGRARDRA